MQFAQVAGWTCHVALCIKHDKHRPCHMNTDKCAPVQPVAPTGLVFWDRAPWEWIWGLVSYFLVSYLYKVMSEAYI